MNPAELFTALLQGELTTEQYVEQVQMLPRKSILSFGEYVSAVQDLNLPKPDIYQWIRYGVTEQTRRCVAAGQELV